MKAWIIMPDDSRIEIGANCQIGRAPGSAIRVDTAEVSRRHAFIHVQQAETGAEFWVADLGSTNGTILNGRRVTIPCRLRDGDRVAIGGFKMVFHAEDIPGHADDDEEVATTVTLQASRHCWLLMIDIKGFTRITQTMPPEALGRTIGTWLRRTRDAIEGAGGIVDKFLGDAIFAYWEAGPDTGKAIAQVLGKLQIMQSERAPDFRIVVHLGPALLAGGAGGANNISGLEVIYTFRMEKVGAGLSLDSIVSEAAKNALESFVPFEPVGTHQLDGFSGEHRMFQFSKLATTTEQVRRED